MMQNAFVSTAFFFGFTRSRSHVLFAFLWFRTASFYFTGAAAGCRPSSVVLGDVRRRCRDCLDRFPDPICRAPRPLFGHR